MVTAQTELVQAFNAYAKRTENDFLIQVAAELNYLVFENVELKNKLWSASRTLHAHDELEPEDG